MQALEAGQIRPQHAVEGQVVAELGEGLLFISAIARRSHVAEAREDDGACRVRVGRGRDHAGLEIDGAEGRTAIDGAEHRLELAARPTIRNAPAVIGVSTRNTEPPHAAPVSEIAEIGVGAYDEAAVSRESFAAL